MSGEAESAMIEDSAESIINWLEVLRIVLVALCSIAVWFRVWEPFPRISLIGVAGVLIGGWPIFKEAIENIAARRMTMELSMSIAILAAAAISEFFTALIITLFVLIAEVLERLTVSRGRRAIRDLLGLSAALRDRPRCRRGCTRFRPKNCASAIAYWSIRAA